MIWMGIASPAIGENLKNPLFIRKLLFHLTIQRLECTDLNSVCNIFCSSVGQVYTYGQSILTLNE